MGLGAKLPGARAGGKGAEGRTGHRIPPRTLERIAPASPQRRLQPLRRCFRAVFDDQARSGSHPFGRIQTLPVLRLRGEQPIHIADQPDEVSSRSETAKAYPARQARTRSMRCSISVTRPSRLSSSARASSRPAPAVQPALLALPRPQAPPRTRSSGIPALEIAEPSSFFNNFLVAVRHGNQPPQPLHGIVCTTHKRSAMRHLAASAGGAWRSAYPPYGLARWPR